MENSFFPTRLKFFCLTTNAIHPANQIPSTKEWQKRPVISFEPRNATRKVSIRCVRARPLY